MLEAGALAHSQDQRRTGGALGIIAPTADEPTPTL